MHLRALTCQAAVNLSL